MRLLFFTILLLTGYFDSLLLGNSTEDLRQSVQAAIKAEDFSKAEKNLSELISHDPKSFDARVGRAWVRMLQGDISGCESDLKVAVDLDAEKAAKARFYIADRAVWKAREFEIKGRKIDAMKIYDTVLTLYPKSGNVYHERGGLKIDMKDYDGAIADLTKAIELDQGHNAYGDSFVLRARAKRAKGDDAGAAADDKQGETKSKTQQ